MGGLTCKCNCNRGFAGADCSLDIAASNHQSTATKAKRRLRSSKGNSKATRKATKTRTKAAKKKIRTAWSPLILICFAVIASAEPHSHCDLDDVSHSRLGETAIHSRARS